jgi:hypothetical protein
MKRSRSPARIGILLLLALGGAACATGQVSPVPGQGQGPAAGVVLTPSSATLLPGSQRSFTAKVNGNADQSVTWTITEGPSGGTVNAAGMYTAPMTKGTYHLVATSTAEPTKSATAPIMVTDAPPTGFTIRDAHPRLWWTPARITQAQAWLASHPFTPGTCDNNGVDSCIDIAWKHVVAGTDCSAAITWAVNNVIGCASPTGNGCDDSRWYGQAAFLSYDWCFDQWAPDQLANFLSNVGGAGRGWNDYLTAINQQAWGGPQMTQSNYDWGNLRNDIELGIATNTENVPAAQAFLADGITTRWAAFAATTGGESAGGVPEEGIAYGSSMAPPIIPFVTVADGGRDLLNETDWYKSFIYWIIYATTPGPTYGPSSGTTAYHMSPYADDEHFVSGGTLHIRPYWQDWMNFASNYWSAIDAGKHARQWLDTVGADAGTMSQSRFVLAHDTSPSALSYAGLPLDLYATGIQYLYGRKAWDSSSTFFHWQLGAATSYRSSEGHVHADVGNFNVWRGGRWISRETTGYSNVIAGYSGTDTRDTTTGSPGGALAHNIVVFGAPLATWGPRLPTVVRGDSVVRRLQSAAGFTYADVDLTNRYLWDTGHASLETGAVVHVERELLFLRSLETTVVLDRLTTGAPTQGDDAGKTAAQVTNTFLLHSEASPTLEDTTHVALTNGTQVLRATTLVPAAPIAVRVVNEGVGLNKVGQYRIEIDTSGAAQRYFLHVLQARGTADGNVDASVLDSSPLTPASGTFTVTLHRAVGGDTVIVFNKGQTSSGGSLDLAGAGAAALSAGVQGITYTDGGPVWGP